MPVKALFYLQLSSVELNELNVKREAEFSPVV